MAMINLQCCECNIPFERSSNNLGWQKKRGARARVFCSKRCFYDCLTDRIAKPCAECGTTVERTKKEFEKSKSSNIFCNHSCSAKYNNANKTHGTRRSKLELYVEQALRKDFPDLIIICNSKREIKSELDFYFPDLGLAIELNGIFHYEPIYGQNKLERIQNNDKQKLIKCYEKGIELCIIDTSSCNYLTQKAKDKYYSIVKELISSVINRIK